MFESKVTFGSLSEGGANPWQHVLVSIWKKASSPFVASQKADLKTMLVRLAALWDLLKTTSSDRSIQSCTFALCWHMFLTYRNTFFSLIFGLFFLFNVMLKVIWETFVQNTLFLLMCNMWKNHLQRWWGRKGSTGKNPFFFPSSSSQWDVFIFLHSCTPFHVSLS